MTRNAPVRDEDEPPQDDVATERKPYIQKAPRNVLVMLIVALVIVLAVIGGMITVMMMPKEDPAAIKMPTYVARSLAEEKPEAKAVTPHQEVVPVIADDEATAAPDQTEAVIDLNEAITPDAAVTPLPTPEAPPVDNRTAPEPAPVQDEPVVTPAEDKQSSIHWDQPSLLSGKKPQIAIVIDDMGLNHPNSRRVVALDGVLTLAFMPYADNVSRQTAEARAKGHELIVHIPMEPDDVAHNNPGPDALLLKNKPEENVARLLRNMAVFSGYVGLNNHMGSRFTGDSNAMRPIMQVIKEKGWWFLDSKTNPSSVADDLAAEMGVPYVDRDVFLDNVQDVAAITAQLKQVEAIARRRGYAVAIGHPHTATIAALHAWLPRAQQAGFQMVPLSHIIAQRFPKETLPRYAVHVESASVKTTQQASNDNKAVQKRMMVR